MLLKERKIQHSVNRSARLWADREKYLPKGVFHYHPIFVESASNAIIKDIDGNSYIDFAGGIGALNVGHCHSVVTEAIRRQAGLLVHTAIHVAVYQSYIKVCEKLCQIAPGNAPKKAVLFNSGAEAVENAVKIARAFTGRQGIISFDMSFHGRTFLAVNLTGKHKPYRQKFGPFPGEIYRVPFPYAYRPPEGVRSADLTAYCLGRINDLFSTAVAPENVAAIIIEPVLGEGGFIVPPADFIPALRKLCDKHGILLIADEVQSGFGRTGKMFAIEHNGVAPDLMTVAKSLAAGMPLSGVVGRADVMDAIEPGGLGGTYGGNPLSCAAAMAVFDIIEHEGVLAKAVKVGARIKERFDALEKTCPIVGESRGLGAMRALELVKNKKTKEPLPEADMKRILYRAAERGLLLIKAGQFGNVIRCLAPLTIPMDQLNQGLDILEGVLKGRE